MFSHSYGSCDKTQLLKSDEIQVSDIQNIINDDNEEKRSLESNESSINRKFGCFSNTSMNKTEERDSLVNSNNYGSVIGRKFSLKTDLHKAKVDISRNVIDFDDLNLKYGKRKLSNTTIGQKVSKSVNKCYKNCSLFDFFIKLFPIIGWIRTYSIRDYLFNDIIAGFTILILHIPQGMAYGMLSGLSAINGLYVSFFPVIVYAFMGTSRHVSIGTFAIISIMSSNAAEKLNALPLEPDFDNTRVANNATNIDFNTLDVLTSLCILTGLFQLVMGFVQLGALSVILSDTLVSAFSTGCAIHVATSQLNSLFDIDLPKNEEHTKLIPFKLINTWISIAKRLVNTNLVTLGLSLFGITILLLVKELIEPKLKKKFSFSVPIPIDILLVIGITLFSWLMKLNETSGVDIMGDIPKGLPSPKLPRLDLFPSIVIDSLVIAIVAFAISLSLAKIYAKKHKYKIDANQELIALGTANIFSSLFACYPSSASLSRSSVQERTSGKTQVAGLVSSLFMLIFLLFLGPLLYHLPKCVLSCIILVALKTMFLQMNDLIKCWKVSKLDAIQWFVTFVSVILLGVDIGLIIGVVFSILLVLLRFTLPKSTINGQLPFSEIYVDTYVFLDAKQIDGIKIFQFHCPLFFMNAHNFKTNLYKKALNISINEIEKLKDEKPKTHTIIIDFSSIFYIDSTGVEVLIEIIEELEELNIKVILTSCCQSVIQMLEKTNFFTKVLSPNICATVHDAVVQNDNTFA